MKFSALLAIVVICGVYNVRVASAGPNTDDGTQLAANIVGLVGAVLGGGDDQPQNGGFDNSGQNGNGFNNGGSFNNNNSGGCIDPLNIGSTGVWNAQLGAGNFVTMKLTTSGTGTWTQFNNGSTSTTPLTYIFTPDPSRNGGQLTTRSSSAGTITTPLTFSSDQQQFNITFQGVTTTFQRVLAINVQ